MPWIQVTESGSREVWLRTEAIIGLTLPERHGRGARLLLLSGASVEVTEDRETLMKKLNELEGPANRDRRAGFPGAE
jgi:hypothetical protein